MKAVVLFVLLGFTMASESLMAQNHENFCSKYKVATSANRLLIEDLRSDSIDILHTRINLDFTNMSGSSIEGYTTLTLKSLLPGISSVTLDFEGLIVDSVIGPAVGGFVHNDPRLVVQFANPLTSGQETDVTVHYHGSPIQDASGWGGFYFTGGFAWNLGVGFAGDPHSYGRIWFPCFDNFIERSTFEFYIHTNTDKRAACNGLLLGETNNGNGTTTYHWKLNQSVPSYLACVAVGSYEPVNSIFAGQAATIPIQVHARASDTTNMKNSFTNLPAAIEAFETAYGPYRFDKVGYSLVPFNSGAMEHATNIAYPISAANGTLNSESLMAHELAHMWWGDNVTCQTDGDMWINEGWASFSEYLFSEAVYGRLAYEAAMKEDLRYMLQFGHHVEGEYRPVSGQPHEYVYGDHVYKKGALVAHNLRGYLGDDVFYDAATAFMENYKYSPVSSDTLERFFSNHTGQDLSAFFRDWVFNPGYNTVVLDSFRYSGSAGTYEIELFLQQKLKGTTSFHEGVPVYYSIFDANWNKVEGKGTMTGQSASLVVSSPIEPYYITLYEHNELAQARTVDRVIVNSTGSVELENMYWDINFDSVSDSALVFFEQYWSHPDPIKEYNTKPWKMSDYRYWKISGLGLENLQMSGQFFYDGRTGGSSAGYLDTDLVSLTEDSIILLYRTGAHDDWRLYEHASKNVLGSSVNAFGLMELSQVLPGEYVLANWDHSVLGVEPTSYADWVSVYPNPADNTLTVAFSEGHCEGCSFQLYDLSGKLLIEKALDSSNAHIDISRLSVTGYYVYSIKQARKTVSGRVLIKHKP